MYCTACGNQNPDDARFCTACGQPLQTAPPPRPSSPSQPPPPRADTPPPQRDVPPFAPPSSPVREDIPNYLVQAILVTICCCLPAGVVSIVFAAQVNGKVERGDIEGARRDSNNAKTWAWISFGLGLAVVVIYFFLALIGVAAGV